MGGASAEGTKEYVADRVREGVSQKHFRSAQGLWLSSIGLGTYLGRNDETTDDLYRRAVVRSVEMGCNVLDTAINYRCQRSERSVADALREVKGHIFDLELPRLDLGEIENVVEERKQRIG